MHLHPHPKEHALLLPYCMHHLQCVCKQVLAFRLTGQLPSASYGSLTSDLLAFTRDAMAPDRANIHHGPSHNNGSCLAQGHGWEPHTECRILQRVSLLRSPCPCSGRRLTSGRSAYQRSTVS